MARCVGRAANSADSWPRSLAIVRRRQQQHPGTLPITLSCKLMCDPACVANLFSIALPSKDWACVAPGMSLRLLPKLGLDFLLQGWYLGRAFNSMYLYLTPYYRGREEATDPTPRCCYGAACLAQDRGRYAVVTTLRSDYYTSLTEVQSRRSLSADR